MHENNDSSAELGNSVQDWKGGDRSVSPTLIAFVIIAIGAVVFIIQNSDKAQVRFLFFTVTTRVWAGILVALVVGAVLDRLIVIWWRRRKERPS